jgi:restriction system protein
MPEMTRERQGQIVRAVFSVLVDQPEGLQVQQVTDEVKARLPLTEFELGSYPNLPGVRFDRLIRFATISPVKAGWLIKNKGIWTITDDGRQALEDFPDPAEFGKEAAKLYRAWKKAQPAANLDGDNEDDLTDATSIVTLEEAEERAWAEIEQALKSLPPFEFQDLVAGLLRAMGYTVSWVAPPGPDRGIDILAYTDPLGAEGPRIKVQVKRRNDTKTPVDDLRAFMAVLSSQDVGLFVSSGGFTSDARSEARNQEQRRITLIDLQDLFDLWIKHYDDLDDEDRRRLPLRPIYFLAPSE